MMVFRCVSSKSKVCDAMPFTSAAPAMSTFSLAPEHRGLRRGLQHVHRAQRRLDALVLAAPTAHPPS
jgi:hypothetical protein